MLPGAVSDHRDGQWLDLSHDPRDFSHAETRLRRRTQQGQQAAALAQAIKEGNTNGRRPRSALPAAMGCVRRVLHSAKSYGSSIELTGGPHSALWCFVAFYLVSMVVTWWCYARKHAGDALLMSSFDPFVSSHFQGALDRVIFSIA